MSKYFSQFNQCDNQSNGNQEQMNLYGSHPFYLQASASASAHGVFLLNTNAISVRTQYTSSLKYLQYQTIGGVLDFYFFLGPDPQSVIEQYHSIIGKPYLPPMWSMGFHQCRWGYQNLDEVKKVVAGYDSNDLPLDTMWNDIDYMYKYWDFTFDPERYPINDLRNFLSQELFNKGRKYVVIVDPGIPTVDLTKEKYEALELGISLDIFIKESSSNNYVQHVVWPGGCYFPDTSHPRFADQYWKPLIHGFLSTVQVSGLWTDMNEIAVLDVYLPANNSFNYPPFTPGAQNEQLFHKTLQLDARMNISTYYNAHNLYGFFETKATADALQSYYGKRSFVLTRSSFAGSGSHVSHWTGDNFSTFESMRTSIASILLAGMFGFSHVGSDIGGFNQDTTKELLIRWMQVGSLYPFSRNHNAINQRSQEPFAFDQETTDISRKYLKNRYALLPYLYTTMAYATMNGGAAAKPLFFEFPLDKNTYTISEQFLFGSALLANPALYYQQTVVTAYFPAATWYDYYTGALLTRSATTLQLPAPLDTFPLAVRGGFIVPKQAPALNTVSQKNNPYNLIVALDNNQQSQGTLFLDDGESLSTIETKSYTLLRFNLTFDSSSDKFNLASNIAVDGYNDASQLYIDSVAVYGIQRGNSICSVTVNGKNSRTYNFDSNLRVLNVLDLKLEINSDWNIQFVSCN